MPTISKEDFGDDLDLFNESMNSERVERYTKLAKSNIDNWGTDTKMRAISKQDPGENFDGFNERMNSAFFKMDWISLN
jgi:hypothetical protein